MNYSSLYIHVGFTNTATPAVPPETMAEEDDHSYELVPQLGKEYE